MRRIISKHEEERRRKRNGFIVGGILIVIMFFSVLGYSFSGSGGDVENSEKIIYNGFEFVNSNNFWFLGLGDFTFGFSYNPYEVEFIESSINPLNTYSSKPLYVYSEDSQAELEIYRNLDPRVNSIVQRIQPACLNADNCEEDIPLKTCEDNFIVIKEGPIAEIKQEENCVFITGPIENLTQITDEFLFKVLGVR